MITLNLPGVLGIAAASLALFLLAKASLQSSDDRAGKALLLVLLGSLLAMAMNSLYFLLGMHQLWPQLSFIPLGLMAWIAPSLYLYVGRVTGSQTDLTHPAALLHWLPGIVIELLLVRYFLLPADDKLDYINSDAGKSFFLLLYVFIYLQILVYVYSCQSKLRAARELAATTGDADTRHSLHWLDDDLSLPGLAARLRLTPHHLSQILNEGEKKNFYDYINAYRIEHARLLLREQPAIPVVDVAIACGYNNKNSFYNSFRHFVGMTPGEYRQQAAASTR